MIETNHMHPVTAARARQDYAKKQLIEKTNGGLIRTFREIYERRKDVRINPLCIGNLAEEIYIAAAAIEVLRDRHGNNFAKAVVRGKPKSRTQCVLYFLNDMISPLFEQRALG